MRSGKMVVLCLLALLALAGIAMAVGFDRVQVNGLTDLKPIGKVHALSQPHHVKPSLSLAEDYPRIVDELVEMAKDFLGQFGLADCMAP